ncbi:BA14K family protein [uncultured Enterovirga sp.]|uniref:BA14K family protein n=1 Tax=uncultured Enterovirga sp. TaxID=2026352 RepID=UPI0035CA87BD
MTLFRTIVAAGAAFGAISVAPITATAAPLDIARKIVSTEAVPVTFAQFRGRRGGFGHRGGFRRGGYGRPYGYRGYGRRGGGFGPGLGLGLATGAILGGALAAQAAPPPPMAYSGNAVAYCSQKYRSFDPASGTYLGYDGVRHLCQLP